MILCGGLQVLILLSITGVLVSLAALSRLMELIFMIIQPAVLFMLRHSLKFILFWIILSLQRISCILTAMCSIRQFDINDSTRPIDDSMIGTTPVRVPYARNNCENELGRKISSLGTGKMENLGNVNQDKTGIPEIVDTSKSVKSVQGTSTNNDNLSELSRISSVGSISNRQASDLGDKVPWLCSWTGSVLGPEYTPYLNTAGTVLLGWMVVCWISHIVWTFLAPLAISAIAVVIVCPSTAKWLIKQMGPNVEIALGDFLSKIQASIPDLR